MDVDFHCKDFALVDSQQVFLHKGESVHSFENIVGNFRVGDLENQINSRSTVSGVVESEVNLVMFYVRQKIEDLKAGPPFAWVDGLESF